MKVEIEKLELTSTEIVDEQRQKLKELFPEVFTEGLKIDFEQFKLTMGEMVDPGKERYGMNWPGKADCFKIIQQPSIATLTPSREESVDFDTTENLFIEGDNLEVLKLLQKSYFGKIKMIYIDPPYNTGNDFIYPDNYSESLDTYLRYTGQIDNEGRKYSTNTEADGRFHSKWMNMMYPRLFLARNLLSEDGFVFISINDGELSSLRLLLNETFGEENFVGIFVWQSKKGGGSDSGTVVSDHEYVVCYGRSNINSLSRTSIEAEPLDCTDEKGPYRRGRELNKWGSGSRREDRPTMYFPIPGPKGEDVYPIRNDGSEGRWRWGKGKMLDIVNRGDVEFVKRSDNTYIAYEKIRSQDERRKPYRTWLVGVGTTADGSKTVKELFGGVKVFEFPKPIDLIKHFIDMGTADEGELILDFFSGSCTTAHALLDRNKEDGGNRRFIMVQLPEQTDEKSEAYKAGFKTIADIGKERIRRVIRKTKEEHEGRKDLFSGGKSALDLGFKVFKLQPSNFKLWNGEVPKDKDSIERQLALFVEHINPKSSQEDILYEILLKSGFPLTTKIEKSTLAKKTVFNLADGSMFICLEKELTPEVIKAMAEKKPVRVVCLDEGFKGNDQLKTNAVQIMKTRNITFRTV